MTYESVTGESLSHLISSSTFLNNIRQAILNTDDSHEVFFEVRKVAGLPTYYTGEIKTKSISLNMFVGETERDNPFYEDEDFLSVPCNFHKERRFSFPLLDVHTHPPHLAALPLPSNGDLKRMAIDALVYSPLKPISIIAFERFEWTDLLLMQIEEQPSLETLQGRLFGRFDEYLEDYADRNDVPTRNMAPPDIVRAVIAYDLPVTPVMAEVMNNLPYFNAASLTIEGEEVSGTEELDRFSYHTDCAGMRESLDRLREAAELYGEELFPF